jgi:hypothetical protein
MLLLPRIISLFYALALLCLCYPRRSFHISPRPFPSCRFSFSKGLSTRGGLEKPEFSPPFALFPLPRIPLARSLFMMVVVLLVLTTWPSMFHGSVASYEHWPVVFLFPTFFFLLCVCFIAEFVRLPIIVDFFSSVPAWFP